MSAIRGRALLVVALTFFGVAPAGVVPTGVHAAFPVAHSVRTIRRPTPRRPPVRSVPVVVPSTTSTTPSTAAPTAPSTTLAPILETLSPQAYLDRVLTFMQRNTARASSVDVPAIVAAAKERGRTAPDIAATYPIIRAALTALGDRHSALLDPLSAASFLRGQSTGFGFRVYPPDVMWVLPGSPAEAAGMKTLDRIQSLNDKPFAQTTAADRMVAVATFAVLRNGEPLQFTVTRGALVTAERPSVREFSGHLGYIDLPGATGDSQAEARFVRSGLDGIGTVETAVRPCGWVLDLRRNSGGFPFSMLSVLEPFLGNGPFLGFAYGDGKRQAVAFDNGTLRVGTSKSWVNENPVRLPDQEVPIALLTSPTTASAGEAAVIAFVGRRNSRTFGEPTVGVTSANVGISLPDGAFVMVTHSYDTDRAGKLYDGPLLPDAAITTDWTTFGTGADPVLTAAQTWLDGQPACVGR